MEKLKMKSQDLSQEHIAEIGKLFPNALTEQEMNGKVQSCIDFDILKQELSSSLASGKKERYQMTWPGKMESILLSNSQTTNTLRPDVKNSVDFDNTKNLYIEGDNLEALKIIRETYLGKIKMIYIDPPYNTGDDFVYKDDFAIDSSEYKNSSGQIDSNGNRLFLNSDTNGRYHTDWLNMIYPRLKIARDLLTEDGAIFISIDDNEVCNLRKCCDEIFGNQNFVSVIVWQSTAGSNTGTDIITVTEDVVVYTKNRSLFKFDGMVVNEKGFSLSDEFEETRGKYSLDKLDRRRVGTHYSEALNYPITMPDGSIRFPGGGTTKSNEGWNYLWSKSKIEWGIKNGFIEFKQINNKWGVYNKRYSKVDNDGKAYERTIPFRNLITSNQCNTAQGTAELRSLFKIRPFDFPKPSEFIKILLETVVRTDKRATILDFFAGSSSTAHAVMKMNFEDGGTRKFILIQIPEKCDEKSEAFIGGYKNICEIGKERIRLAGKELLNKYGKTRSIDCGFRDYKIDSSNMKDVFYSSGELKQTTLGLVDSNIKDDRTPFDLLIQVMLNLGISLSSSIETKKFDNETVFCVNGNSLVACFGENIENEVIEKMAKMEPLYACFRDSSFSTDSVSVNCEQIFRTLSPVTKIKVI